MKLSQRLRPFLPEAVTVLLLIVAFILSAIREPKFLDVVYLFDCSTLYSEVGLLTIGLTLIIVAGHIDLSCTAILALVGALVTTLAERAKIPFAALIFLAPLLGGALGAINGYFVAIKKLPSLVVTIATMAIFRGVAQILLGDHSLAAPPWFIGLEKLTLPKTYFHLPLIAVFLTACVAGFVLHKTVFGRFVYAVGTNTEAARYSGVPVAAVLMKLFITSGVLSGCAALLLVSRLGVARFDHARGLELDAITAVVLGGTSIFGGRGTVFGSIAALVLIGVVQTGMGVAGVKAENQIAVIGVLLLVSVLLANLTRKNQRK